MSENHQATILVVDDTATNLRIVFDWLTKENYKVLAMKSGVKAVSMLDQIEPDLILMDLMMPEMDGFETTTIIKKHPAYESTPVIVMTALTDIKSKVKAFEAGAVDYVTKPLQQQELLARIKTHLELRSARLRLEEDNLAKQAMIQELNAFAHTVAHDLKNPLSIIMGFAETLTDFAEDFTPQEIDEIYRDIASSGRKMSQIIHSLLLLASTRDKEVDLHPTPVKGVFNEVGDRLKEIISTNNAKIHCRRGYTRCDVLSRLARRSDCKLSE